MIDHGKLFFSETFSRAGERLGISIQPARKDTPTDKADYANFYDDTESAK